MKFTKHFFSGLSLLALVVFFATSCVNSSDNTEATAEEDSIANDEILYVEDFAQFKSHEDLVAHFGEKEVIKEELYLEEGTVKVLISKVFPKSNHPLTVYWKSGYKNIESVEVSKILYDKDFNISFADDNYWNFKNELKLGMTIQELQKVNGGVFKFYGLGWDNGGNVFSKNKIFDKYSFTMGYVTKSFENLPKNYNAVEGDQELSSDNKAANELPLKLVNIRYNF